MKSIKKNKKNLSESEKCWNKSEWVLDMNMRPKKESESGKVLKKKKKRESEKYQNKSEWVLDMNMRLKKGSEKC